MTVAISNGQSFIIFQVAHTILDRASMPVRCCHRFAGKELTCRQRKSLHLLPANAIAERNIRGEQIVGNILRMSKAAKFTWSIQIA